MLGLCSQITALKMAMLEQTDDGNGSAETRRTATFREHGCKLHAAFTDTISHRRKVRSKHVPVKTKFFTPPKTLLVPRHKTYCSGFGSLPPQTPRNSNVDLVVKLRQMEHRYINADLQGNRDNALREVKRYGGALGRTSDYLRDDFSVVLEAVKQKGGLRGNALRYASRSLRSNREIVVEAVKQDGYALQWASEELQSDRGVVLLAVEKRGEALKYASEELKADREIATQAQAARELVVHRTSQAAFRRRAA